MRCLHINAMVRKRRMKSNIYRLQGMKTDMEKGKVKLPKAEVADSTGYALRLDLSFVFSPWHNPNKFGFCSYG